MSTTAEAVQPTFVDRVGILIATGFGGGFSPVAPGTVGSLIGIPLVYLLAPWMGPGEYVAGILLITVLFFLGVWAATRAERVYRKKDDGRVCYDEIVGFMVTMLWIQPTVPALILGFLVTRAVDIVKPFPAYQSQALRSGWGIMMDDVIASVYGHVALGILLLLLAWLGLPLVDPGGAGVVDWVF